MRELQMSQRSTAFEPFPASEIESADDNQTVVPEWLEGEAVAGFRFWELAAIIVSVVLTILVAFCCCFKFRIPRTKQEIEADHIRLKIAKSFRKELAKIADVEMDEMTLKKALVQIQLSVEAKDEESLKIKREREELRNGGEEKNTRTQFGAFLHGIRVRYAKKRPDKISAVI